MTEVEPKSSKQRVEERQIHLMVDIETFGNYPTACVQQIGWALFDPTIDDGHIPILESGNIFVSVDDCLRRGLTVNESCLQWWLQQTEEARIVACKKGADLDTALGHFNQYAAQATRYWCSAPSFDYAILENAARACMMRLTWNRKEMLCLRTLRRMTPWIKKNHPIPFEISGVAHQAEYDAVRQAVETVIRLRSVA